MRKNGYLLIVLLDHCGVIGIGIESVNVKR